jgi:hypothetical protein
MALSTASLAAELDAIYSTASYVVAILDGLLSVLPFTVDIGTDPTHLVFAAPHKLVTNSRIRLSVSAGGALPACATPLLTTAEYFAIRVDANTIQLKETVGGVALTLLSNGVGVLTATESELSPADSVAVLVNHEVSHPDILRFTYAPGAAVPGATDARTPEQTFNIAVAPSSPPFVYRRVLLIRGGSLTVGDVTGSRPELDLRPIVVTIQPSGSGDLKIQSSNANA